MSLPALSQLVTARLRALSKIVPARVDGALYAVWAGFVTLASARMFYGYMLRQTSGEWSAPLDDVFIHFDYARATASGHPFEWVIGNGYSSGNTSLLYPFVLAIGYASGFDGEHLMLWAAIVAAVSVFATLLAARSLFFWDIRGTAPRWTWMRVASFLLPPMLLGIGALDWSLWSGMEVAIFLGTWAAALSAFESLRRAPSSSIPARSWLLGICGVLMIVTRPEAATTIAVFGIAAAAVHHRQLGARGTLGLLLRVGAPSVLAIGLQTLANRLYTGEFSANGALVKLAVNNPFLTPQEKLADYTFNLKYVILRNVEYHFTDAPAFGIILPALALGALAVPSTRRVAAILWAQIVGWMLLVSFNGQVRWQNERYTMPAVAWLLIAAAIGVGGLMQKRGRPSALVVVGFGALAIQIVGVVTREPNTAPELRVSWALAFAGSAFLAAALSLWPARIVAVALALFFAHDHQISKMRDQKWFFGRACRNIRDQHLVAGRWLSRLKPHRVLVGDAGALIYASDRLGLDIIGLGGFHKLPFARAGVQGLPATLELLERVPRKELPDVLAIFPTWWGVLPTWFSSEVLARFPVEGNVICGGYEDVIYRADWHLLGTGENPRTVPDGQTVRDSLDVADLVSEKEHAYTFPTPGGGWTDMKVLADPADERRDMFDGGRRIPAGRAEHFKMRGLRPGQIANLIIRSAPDSAARVILRVNGAPLMRVELVPTEGWVEGAAEIPIAHVLPELDIELFNEGPGDFVDYHTWVTQ